MIEGLYDASLAHPSEDLLGVAPSAQILASTLRGVQAPFTAGIYGEWGSGKTTFVSFVAHYLKETILREDGTSGVLFIPFSAWPYKTADEVWRALILRIAQQLLGLPESAPAPTARDESETFGEQVKSFLSTEIVVIRDEAPAAPDAALKYANLVKKLDGSLYGGISKSPLASARVNVPEASLAAVKGVVAAMAGMSPMMAAARRLLGVTTDVDPAKVFDREQNESTRRRIESMDGFRLALKELFLENLDGRRVFVFVDDLDRCMPDAALDLLEAIKIFLKDDAPCVFIVAADEVLIGDGLRMRLGLSQKPEDSEAILTRKGRQYFEKIIQLPVHLPRPGNLEIQRFIGAMFPEWMPTSDLIEAAIGTNPRRVKQYCSRLQYRRMVLNPRTECTLFDELVTLRSKDETLFNEVCDLARKGPFAEAMGELEAWAADPQKMPQSNEAVAVQNRIGKSRSLLRILAEPPEMSKADPRLILTLARFADLRPDAERMFVSADPIFMRLVDSSKSGVLDVKKLMLDDLAKLASVSCVFPALAVTLAVHAQSTEWAADMAAVEAALRAKTPTIPSAKADAIVREINATPPHSDGTTAGALIAAPPLLSSIPCEEVIAYARMRDSLPNPDTLIDRTITPNPSLGEKGRALAELAINELTADEMEAIGNAFRTRKDVIEQVVALRTFVKKDILEHCWPGLFDLMRSDYARLAQFERDIQSPDPGEAVSVRLEPYLKDERLVRVFKLHPYFGNMRDGASTHPAAAPAAAAQAPELPATVLSFASPAAPDVPPPSLIEPPSMAYEDVYLTIRRDKSSSPSYVVQLRDSTHVLATSTAKLDWKAMRKGMQGLPYMREVPTIRSVRDVTPPPRHEDLRARLKALGLMVYDQLFKSEVRREFLNLVASSKSLRIHWEGDPDDPGSAILPWECLYVPSAAVSFLALTRNYSLTRCNANVRSTAVSPITGVLRILFVAASPRMVAPLPMVDQEMAALGEIVRGSRVELRTIARATVEDVNQVLREFRPHIFHFSGHGVFRDGEGHLVFQSESGEASLLSAEQAAVLLHDNDAYLAVLNGCDTGVSSTNDAVSSVAGALVKAGVPAVVATMREVQDEDGMLFTREFYRSFLAGFTLEGSIAETRKALSLDYRDWAAYALFTGSVDLNAMRVVNAMRSEQSSSRT